MTQKQKLNSSIYVHSTNLILMNME